MSQLKKVLQQINQNKLTIKDIRTRDRYWYKPFELEGEYLDLICYTGWECWKNNYKFLPLPSIWEEIQGGTERRGVVKQLDDYVAGYRQVVDNLPLRAKINYVDTKYEKERVKELTERALVAREYEQTNGKGGFGIPLKNKEGNTEKTITLNKYASFRLMEYFVVRNTNNTLTILTKNTRQLDLARPDIVFFFRGNKFTSKAKTKKEARMMYWISSFDYINDRKGWVQITLEKDYFWQYWGNVANSRGKAIINSSQLGTTHAEHKEDYNQQNEEYCRACDLCYDFCGDLRNKRAVPLGYINPGKPQWQPQFKLLVSYGGIKGKLTGLAIPDDEGGSPLVVPNGVFVERFIIAEGESVTQFGDKPVLYFMVDKEHEPEKSPIAKAIHKPVLDGKNPQNHNYWEELPKCYTEQPHLLNHSSLQCYFQKKLLFTANLKHLLVRKKGSGDNFRWVIGYHIMVRSSIAGILYNFESGEIFFKWELKIKGQFQSISFIDGMIDKLFGAIGMGSDSGIESQMKGLQEGGNWWSNIGRFFQLVKIAATQWVKKQIGADFNQMLTGERYKEFLGIKEDNNDDKNQAESELQTERQKKSTAKSQHRTVEPSIFYSNTVDFNYDFFEFANRTINSPFIFRFEHSNLLYDNLVNNKQNPAQSFTVNNFSQLKQLLTEGEWQGQVELFDFPIKGFFERILSSGTTFYKDLSEYFKPWRPRFKTLQSFTYGDTSNMDVASGQEEVDVEEKTHKEEHIEQIGEFNVGDKQASFQTYLYTNDDNLYRQIRARFGGHTTEVGRTVESHWNSRITGQKNAFCWGCDCRAFEAPIQTGGEVVFLSSVGGSEQIMTVPDNCAIICDPKRGVFEVKTTTEWTEKNYKYNFKFDRIEAEKEQEIVGIDYKEPDFMPQETELDVDVEMDIDIDKEDYDFEDETEGMEGGEQEQDEDWDQDIDKDKDLDVDEDKDDDQDLDDDIDVDLDSDKDSDKDDDRDTDDDKDSDKDDRDDDGDRDDDDDQDRE